MYPWETDRFWFHRRHHWVPPQAEVHWEDWVWQWLHKRCPMDAEKPAPSHVDSKRTTPRLKGIPEECTSLSHADKHANVLRQSLPYPLKRNGLRDVSLESAEQDLAMTKQLSARVERTLRRYPAQETAVSRTLRELREHSRQVERVLNKYNLDTPSARTRLSSLGIHSLNTPSIPRTPLKHLDRYNLDPIDYNTSCFVPYQLPPKYPYGVPSVLPNPPADLQPPVTTTDEPITVDGILRKYGLENDSNIRSNRLRSSRSHERFDAKPVRRMSLNTDLGVSSITKASDRINTVSQLRCSERGPLTSSALRRDSEPMSSRPARPVNNSSLRRSTSLRAPRPAPAYRSRSRSPSRHLRPSQDTSLDNRPPFVVRKLDDESLTSFDSGLPRSRGTSSYHRRATTPEPRTYYGLYMDDIDYDYLPAHRQLPLRPRQSLRPTSQMLEQYLEPSPYVYPGIYDDYHVLRRPPAPLPIDPYVY